MRKRLGLLSALFLVAGVTLAQQARQQDYPTIVNLLRVDRLVSTGGQPMRDDLARLKGERVKAVINQLGSLPAYGLRFWSATSTPASA